MRRNTNTSRLLTPDEIERWYKRVNYIRSHHIAPRTPAHVEAFRKMLERETDKVLCGSAQDKIGHR